MCDLCRKTFVVHEEEVDFPNVVDEEFFKTVGEKVSCLLVAPVTNLTQPVTLE
jgi:hypothetical protein